MDKLKSFSSGERQATVYSPKQAAAALGVSEASLKRWCDRGALAFVKTVGGHRRIPRAALIDFLRKQGRAPVEPEALGLPAQWRGDETDPARAISEAAGALEAGSQDRFHALLLHFFLRGYSLAEIFDRMLAPALHGIGEHWQHGEAEIYQERRAVEISLRSLRHLRFLLPSPSPEAPVAIGASLPGDPYTLAITMSELVLREAGWRADSYGPGQPAETICAALRNMRPRLLWLGVSSVESESAFLSAHDAIYETAAGLGVAVVVGGRALSEDLRRQMRYSTHCDTMVHLSSFAETLFTPPASGAVATLRAMRRGRKDSP